jgi:hypothetical protein
MTCKLWAPVKYWELSEKERQNFKCGPGRGILEKLVPDKWRLGWPLLKTLSITPSCAIHDFCYAWGPDTIDWKNEADRAFRNNLIRQITAAAQDYSYFYFPITRARLMKAEIYYQFVVQFGGPSFWAGRNHFKEMSDPFSDKTWNPILT